MSSSIVASICLAQSPLSIKIAQKPYMIGSLGPKALKHESLEGKGLTVKAFQLQCVLPHGTFEGLEALVWVLRGPTETVLGPWHSGSAHWVHNNLGPRFGFEA